MKNWYSSNEEIVAYDGPWEPYVKDFDPTLNDNFLIDTLEMADNAVSRYIAQKGKCAVTHEILTVQDMVCHHIKVNPRERNDTYRNLMQNEPDRTWNKEMHKLLQEMIHEVNQLEAGQKCGDIQISRFEKRYQAILEKAKEEYEYEPASKYYLDGYNLYKRLDKYSKNHLLFLHDPRIPHNNNEAERRLRNYKRKQKQAVSFRCFDSIDYFCQGMSMLVLMRQKEENVFDRTSEIFG